MQCNILWTGREYYSLENCVVDMGDKGQQIVSTIVGLYQNKMYRFDYRIIANTRWETISFGINGRYDNRIIAYQLLSDGKGNWKQNGHEAAELAGCMDVDIPLTPFTNTLPIRRLGLLPGASQEISVVYCDLLAGRIIPVRQKYTCISITSYQYENVPNDFEATLQVDASGLVVDYPSQFEQKAILRSQYGIRHIP